MHRGVTGSPDVDAAFGHLATRKGEPAKGEAGRSSEKEIIASSVDSLDTYIPSPLRKEVSLLWMTSYSFTYYSPYLRNAARFCGNHM